MAKFISEKIAGSLKIAGQCAATKKLIKLVIWSHTATREILQTRVSFGDKWKRVILLLMPDMGDNVVLRWGFLREQGAMRGKPNYVTKKKKMEWLYGA